LFLADSLFFLTVSMYLSAGIKINASVTMR
jgi:hypothetical protein